MDAVAKCLKSDNELRQYPNGEKNWIQFQDCIYNLATGETCNNSPAYYSTNQIPWKYSEIAAAGKPTVFDKFISNQIPDEEQRENVLEYFAYCMTPDTRFQKMMILYGKANSGKGTLTSVLHSIVGEQNISSLSLQDMDQKHSESRFRTSALVGKTVNICGDLPNEPINDISFIKQILGQDAVTIEEKFKSPFTAYLYAKHLFNANEIPNQIGDSSSAWWRRLEIIVMDQAVKADKVDTGLRGKLHREIPAIIKELLEHGKLLYQKDQGQAFVSKIGQAAIEESRSASDNVAAFIKDNIEKTNGVDGFISKHKVFEEYQQYCWKNDRKPCGQYVFYKRMANNGIEEGRPYIDGKNLSCKVFYIKMKDKLSS